VSRVQAANNALNAFSMVVAAVASGAALAAGLPLMKLIMTAALINAAVAVYIFSLVPEFLYRFLCWCLVTLLYRFRLGGDRNIPDKGAALLVCNHVSYADALVVSAGVWRPVRFVMDHQIYDIPLLHWIFLTNKTIPIAPRKEDAALLEQAYAEIVQALKDGELVCVFPEGGITRDGELKEFRPGILHVLEEIPVPVIPMAVSGLWGSLASRAPLAERLKRFRLFRKVRMNVGEPVSPQGLDLAKLHDTVETLRGLRR
jgi:1-acyl-sn-glycerol-3-phosphate acyltransferase